MSDEHLSSGIDPTAGSGFPNDEVGPSKLSGEEAEVEETISTYLKECSESSIVTAALTGAKPGFRTWFIWNVLPDEAFGDQDHPGHTQISAAAEALIHKLRFPLRIANVPQSHLASLQRHYEAVSFILEAGQLDGSQIPPAREAIDSPSDRLIGGLRPFEEHMQQVYDMSAEVNARIGDGYRGHLGIFGKTDQETAQLLETIALARCHRAQNTMFLPFALMEEPFKMLGEMGERELAFNVQMITTLDVTGAVESGALRVR